MGKRAVLDAKESARPTATPSASAVARTLPAQLFELQAAAGNRATVAALDAQALLTAGSTTVQTKLTVGPADDQFERNADEIAKQVVSRLERRDDLAEIHRADGLAQRALALDGVGAEGGEVDAHEDRAIRQEVGRGRPLDRETRTKMETAFGADFRRIRVHTDSNADRLSRALSADAFTTGSDIFFREAVYQPTTTSGTRVLAHELAHTVQQGAASVAGPPVVQRLFGANARQAKKAAKAMKAGSFPAIESTLANAEQGAANEAEIRAALAEVERCQVVASKLKGRHGAEQQETLRYMGDELGLALDQLHVWETQAEAEMILIQNSVERAQQGVASVAEIENGLLLVEQGYAASRLQGKRRSKESDALRIMGDELGIALDRIRMAETRQQAKDIYGNEARTGGLKALTPMAQASFDPNFVQPDEAAAHGLSQHENAAVYTYTADDYKYINPAAAYSKGWMQSQMQNAGQTGTEKERFQEGGLHTAMMMEAFAKLPVWQGDGFRGERLTPAEFAEKFTEVGNKITAKKKTEEKANFWSVSTDRAVSEGFASSASNAAKTVSVLYVIHVVDARDVQKLSAYKGEAEVLCPAGAKFDVASVTKQTTGVPGNPAATAWYIVDLQQLAPGTPSRPKNPAPNAKPGAQGAKAAPNKPAPPPKKLPTPPQGMPKLPATPTATKMPGLPQPPGLKGAFPGYKKRG